MGNVIMCYNEIESIDAFRLCTHAYRVVSFNGVGLDGWELDVVS